MNPNTNAMRFIADCIRIDSLLFDHGSFGESECDTDVAGTGTSCETPACVAGFAVQFLGNPVEYGKRPFSLDPSKYAAHLLGLSHKWSDEIFNIGLWPEEWLDSEMPIILESDRAICYDKYKLPTALEAEDFLNRLADQFDKEYGTPPEWEVPVAWFIPKDAPVVQLEEAQDLKS